MRRDVQAVLLVLLGGAVLRISTGDVYLRYVKEPMRPWLLLTGAILLVLGVLLLVDVVRSARHAHDLDAEEARTDAADPVAVPVLASTLQGHDEVVDPGHVLAPDVSDVAPFDDGHGHHHGGRGPRSAWMLLLPVLAIFLVAPPALGAYTAEREASSVAPPAQPQAPPLPAGDPVPLALNDYAARAVWDDGRTLVGRTIRMTGFASAAPGGQWYLTRLQLTCCAADAIPTKILPKDAPAVTTNTWVTVTGTWVPGGGTQREDAIPWFKVQELEKVPPPKNAYE